MTEITLRLTEEQARQLAEEARRKDTTLESVATQLLADALALDAADQTVMSEAQFQESLDRTMKENQELLKRLA